MPSPADPERQDVALMRRLFRNSLFAWTAITLALTVYVLRTYPSEDSFLEVLGRQTANWMPFCLVLPALHAAARWARARPNPRSRALVWVAVCALTVVGYSMVRFALLALLLLATGGEMESWTSEVMRMWPIAAIVCAVLVAVLFGVYARLGQQRAEDRARRLEAELTRAQLRALQSQIRPHFLFNTLQAIEDACWRDPKTASAMVLQLSELLRACLEDERRPLKTLGDDLQLARQYIALQRARFGDRLTYEEDVDPSLTDQPFPTLLLQPLLENAIVHGIEPMPNGGTVRISIQREGPDFVLRITNDGPAVAAPERSGGGIGLANTAARLESVYGPSAKLTIASRPEGGASVEARVALGTST